MVFDAIGNVCDGDDSSDDGDSCISSSDDGNDDVANADADVEDNNGGNGGTGKLSVRTSMSTRRVSKIVRDFREKKERERELQARLQKSDEVGGKYNKDKDKDPFIRCKDRSDSFVDYGFNPRR